MTIIQCMQLKLYTHMYTYVSAPDKEHIKGAALSIPRPDPTLRPPLQKRFEEMIPKSGHSARPGRKAEKTW